MAEHADTSKLEATPPVLHVEMHAGERRVVTLFAASFLEWVEDARGSRFARSVGVPEHVAFDEATPDSESVTLRLTLTWPASQPGQVSEPGPAIAVGAPQSPEMRELKDSLFVYEAQEPAFGTEVAAAGVTTMMAAVVQQSIRLRRRAATPWDSVRRHAARVAERGAQLRQALRQGTRRVAERGSQWRQVLPLGTRRAWPRMAVASASIIFLAVTFGGWPAIMRSNNRAVTPAAVKSATVAVTPLTPPLAPEKAVPTPQAPVPAARDIRPASTVPVVLREAARVTRVAPPGRFVGSLRVTSLPAGAEVWVDGVQEGRTPLTIRRVNAGSRIVRLQLPGHQRWSWAVSVAADRQNRIDVKLWPDLRPSMIPGP